MIDLHAALHGLAAAAALAFATWIASVARHDVSLVDRVWSSMIGAAAITVLASRAAPTPRDMVMLVLVGVWAARLAYYVTRRNWGHGEDRRYQQIRARNEPYFAAKSLVLIFGLQAVLATLVAAPFLASPPAAPTASTWGWADTFGALIAAGGIAMEAVADAQMGAFKADPGNRQRVMDRGLWRYSRHPNYFGECCLWWGLWCMAFGSGGAWWAIVSPLLMTVLLLKVSGVSLLEKDIGERRPAYRDYIARTNAFIPGRPKVAPGGQSQ